jgi:hypothetical protein
MIQFWIMYINIWPKQSNFYTRRHSISMAGFQDAHAGQDILQTMKQYLSLTEIMEPK